MSVKELLILSKSSPILATIALMVGMHIGQAKAEEFNTAYVFNKLPKEQGLAHVDGVVRGIAYSHYFKSKKDQIGFECVLDYALSGDDAKWDNMVEFARMHPDKALGGVLFVYLRKKCNL